MMRESVDYTTAILYLETKILKSNLKNIIKNKLENQNNKNNDINMSLKKYFKLS
jgi:hypothetical protein